MSGELAPGSVIDEPRILYEDDRCLGLNKLPGEAVEGAGPGMIDLPRLLAERYDPAGKRGKPPFPITAVNRLDVPVSGCALFAREPRALRTLNADFAGGRVEKRYWAILEAAPAALAMPETGELVHWLGTDLKHNKSFAHHREAPGLKKAILRYWVRGAGQRYVFWEIELITGRRHQIRAQLAALGLHIKGDLKYGARRSEKNGGIRLHARSLAFPDPGGPGTLNISADPPLPDPLWEAFAQALAQGISGSPAGGLSSGPRFPPPPKNAGTGT
jgi:23S rRNA pseudouridine1911/1915/1917 synthase